LPDWQHAEIVNGQLHLLPSPSPPHVMITSHLGVELCSGLRLAHGSRQGWWILDEPELQLVPLEPMIPDLAGWRAEHMPTLPETAYFPLAPDWVCEVLSRSTERLDRKEKLPLYARHGVKHAWLIDPKAKLIELHTLVAQEGHGKEVKVYAGDARVRIEPFTEVVLDLSALWNPTIRPV
jgi:Uma2 family endonuclease